MYLSHLSLRARLVGALSGLALTLLLVSVLAVLSLADAGRSFQHFMDGVNARAHVADSVRAAVDSRAIAARNLVLVTKPGDLEKEKAAALAADQQVQQRLAQLLEMGRAADVPAEARAAIAAIEKVEAAYGPVARRIVAAASEGRHEEAIAMMNNDCRPLLAALLKAADDYAALTDRRIEREKTDSAESFALHRNVLVGASLLALLLAAGAAWSIPRSVHRALGADPAVLGGIVERIAQGDLARVAGSERAPAGSVLANLGHMQARLCELVDRVRRASDSISTGSHQIASGNADLSQRTEEQASALQQTAATMDELNSTVRNNADNARQADQLALGASRVATDGGAAMQEVVATMKRIDAGSRRIADIIGVIDGIAFQTNILALNAAVEAARAGEQGRGFAVVAGEVRGLAGRCADAAREIKSLIAASVDQVVAGTSLVDQAGATMGDLVQSVQRVSEVVSAIASASTEQANGVGQVGHAVTEMDRVTQQNAALVEQSAAAAESLRQQAAQLVDAVSCFRFDAAPGAVAA